MSRCFHGCCSSWRIEFLCCHCFQLTSQIASTQILPNIHSELQNISENESNNINMSIPEYSSYSTITSSSINSDTFINAKIGTPNKTKPKIWFDSDPTSNKLLCNNMRRRTTTKTTKIQYYTINDTTESDSTTSNSISTKKSKNSDASYQPSTNDNSTSPSLKKKIPIVDI